MNVLPIDEVLAHLRAEWRDAPPSEREWIEGVAEALHRLKQEQLVR